MTEADYITVTNLAKLRIAEHVLREVLPDGELTDEQHREMLALIRLRIQALEARADRLVRG